MAFGTLNMTFSSRGDGLNLGDFMTDSADVGRTREGSQMATALQCPITEMDVLYL